MDCHGRLIVDATVIGVGDGPFYYQACRQCYSKLVGQIENFCPKCKNVKVDAEVNQRYRLLLTISDGLSLTKVTVFGNVIAPYFGCAATDFHKWRESSRIHITPLLLKCALEKTMVGSSLLFGFKGNIKKPKGTGVTLKDVDNMCHSTASHTTRSTDLIAFQMLPQNESLCPIPVIQYLQNLCTYFENHEKSFEEISLNQDYNYISNVLFDIDDVNSSVITPHEGHACPKESGDRSIRESDVTDPDSDSNFLLSLAESEISIGLSMTQSPQNSCNASNVDCSSTSIPSNYDGTLGLNESSCGSVSLQSTKSSWCVKNWLRKHKDVSNNSSKAVDKSTRMSKATNSFSRSLRLCTSPEQAREIASNVSSSVDFVSNFSSVDIVPSPPVCHDRYYLKSKDNVFVNGECNKFGSKTHSTAGKSLKYLTLKSNDNGGSSMQNCRVDKMSLSRHENENSFHLSFEEIPESEDFDLFMAAVGSDNVVCKVGSGVQDRPQKIHDVAEMLSNKYDAPVETGTEVSKSDFVDENVTQYQMSFQYVPESEDSDLFLAAFNLEKLQLDLKSSETPAKAVIDQSNNNVQGVVDKPSLKLTPKCLFPLASDSDWSKESRLSPIICFSSQLQEHGSCSPCLFNESCDLFESPVQSHNPRKVMLKTSITIANDKNHVTNSCVDDSVSLFSFSTPSHQERNTFPVNQKSDNADVLHHSYCDESFVDLFSPTPRTHNQGTRQSCPRDCFTSSCGNSFYCNSPDLFSSPGADV